MSRRPIATVYAADRPCEAARLSILTSDGRCADAPLDARQCLDLASQLLEHAARSVALAHAVEVLLPPREAAPAPASPKRAGTRRVWKVGMALLFAGASVAAAAPPPGADPDSPIGQWYRSLRVPGTDDSCCGQADCLPRPLRLDRRAGGDVWQVRATEAEGGNWLDVPPEAISDRTDNPRGAVISCVVGGKVVCLFWGGAV